MCGYAGRFCETLGLVRHLSIQRAAIEFSIIPATGLHSESNRVYLKTFPKGTFKARTSKGIFSQFLVFRIGLPKMHAESGVWFRPEDHTVARRERHINLSQVFVIPNRAESPVRHALSLSKGTCCWVCSWQLSRPRFRNSRCGNHLEILWEASIDGVFAALYVYQVSRTVGFVLTMNSPGLNSRRSGGPRFGL
jgi:hypothetical protein